MNHILLSISLIITCFSAIPAQAAGKDPLPAQCKEALTLLNDARLIATTQNQPLAAEQKNEDKCAICLTVNDDNSSNLMCLNLIRFDVNNIIRQFTNQHRFHVSCVTQWFVTQDGTNRLKRCPLCKGRIEISQQPESLQKAYNAARGQRPGMRYDAQYNASMAGRIEHLVGNFVTVSRHLCLLSSLLGKVLNRPMLIKESPIRLQFIDFALTSLYRSPAAEDLGIDVVARMALYSIVFSIHALVTTKSPKAMGIAYVSSYGISIAGLLSAAFARYSIEKLLALRRR